MASSFIFKKDDQLFLITNLHNVTGRDPATGEVISDHAGIPDLIVAYLRTSADPGRALRQTIRLYEDDNMTQPRWLVHPKYNAVDVIALPISNDPSSYFQPINELPFDVDIRAEVADDCFIVGYPFSEFTYLGLPIWKRASIATEPTVNVDQLPKLLVDTATRSGMSGAPVIYQRIGVHRLKEGKLSGNSTFGRIRGFLGVYSGRLGNGEMLAQLGIVWKARVIEEIIDGGKRGDTQFQRI